MVRCVVCVCSASATAGMETSPPSVLAQSRLRAEDDKREKVLLNKRGEMGGPLGRLSTEKAFTGLMGISTLTIETNPKP